MEGESVSSCSGAMITLFDAGPVAGLSDGELLDRFVERDGLASESAVSALVARHSAMVWRACRTSVGNDSDASDAFQATFLILLRQARSIRNRSTVGAWLGGVARRVAANARASSIRRRIHEGAVAGRTSDEANGELDVLAGEVAAIVREELARLSERDRDVVLACDLDGLTETEAAHRLGCPVGTVRSRLHRARAKLRQCFQGRGLDPTAALGVLPTFGIGKIPPNLVATTVALAARSGSGVGSWAKFAPAAVALLIHQTGRSLIMISMIWTSAVVVGVAGIGAGVAPWLGMATVVAPVQDPPKAAPSPMLVADRADKPEASAKATETKAEAMADRYRQIVDEYEAAKARSDEAAKSGKSEFEKYKLRDPLRPDEEKFARRMVDLAVIDPTSKAARDAAIWVMDKTWMSDVGVYTGEYDSAVNILIGNYADDPEAVRVGLQLDNILSRRRDAFLEGCYANATGHESKGLARLAYAQYLDRKVASVRAAHKFSDRNKIFYEKYDDQGKLVPTSIEESNEDFAYKVGLRWIEADAMRAEAERLYNEVIAEYGDVLYINRGRRRLEAMLAKPLKPDSTLKEKLERVAIEQMIKQKTTLAQVAKSRLYKMTSLAAGKPAPEVEGVDLITNQPFKLSDQRGKVVLLYFWAEGGGANLIDQIKKREASERTKATPLVVIGVGFGDTSDAVRQSVANQQIPWLNTYGGKDMSAPIAGNYQLGNLSTVYLIDPEGKIAQITARGHGLEVGLDQLLGAANESRTAK